jgi:hypothetical protein
MYNGRCDATVGSLLGANPRAMLCQPLLYIFRGLYLDLLGRVFAVLARRRVAGSGVSIGLCLVEVLNKALVVLLDNVLGDTLHTEDLDLETLSIRERIFDKGQRLLVDLIHMHR